MKHKLIWSTYEMKICDFKVYEKNPRKITEQEKRKLEESLTKFNVVETPVLDFDRTLLTWHQRYHAMIALGRGDEQVHVRMPNRPGIGRVLKAKDFFERIGV